MYGDLQRETKFNTWIYNNKEDTKSLQPRKCMLYILSKEKFTCWTWMCVHTVSARQRNATSKNPRYSWCLNDSGERRINAMVITLQQNCLHIYIRKTPIMTLVTKLWPWLFSFIFFIKIFNGFQWVFFFIKIWYEHMFWQQELKKGVH